MLLVEEEGRGEGQKYLALNRQLSPMVADCRRQKSYYWSLLNRPLHSIVNRGSSFEEETQDTMV
uniref:Uncharacterized protein n=1 Tax=Romanomermis culicivorax TaxID=13658 RepID=A0A915HGI8_ROMCU